MKSFFALLLVCLVAGCHGKGIKTNMIGQMTSITPSTQIFGPVVKMSIPSTTDADGPRIVILDVDGVLLNTNMNGMGSMGDNPVGLFREKLDAIAEDPCVKGVVLRINSPGGGVTATDMMWRELVAFKQRTGLPVVASFLDVGAGGAYYLATAADRIVAHPTTVTGGVGVILNLYLMESAMTTQGVVGVPVKSGENIDLGSPVKPMTEETRQLLQNMADEFAARFRQIVKESRPGLAPAAFAELDGRVFTAPHALKLGFIDEIGYLDDAVQMARELSGCMEARMVMFHRCNDRARSPYALTPNVPLQGAMLPLSIPGLDRSRLPTFLYLWQPDPSLEKWAGH